MHESEVEIAVFGLFAPGIELVIAVVAPLVAGDAVVGSMVEDLLLAEDDFGGMGLLGLLVALESAIISSFGPEVAIAAVASVDPGKSGVELGFNSGFGGVVAEAVVGGAHGAGLLVHELVEEGLVVGARIEPSLNGLLHDIASLRLGNPFGVREAGAFWSMWERGGLKALVR